MARPGGVDSPTAIPGLVARVGSLADLPEFADATELETCLKAQDMDEVWQRIDTDPAILAVLLADALDIRFIWIGGQPSDRTIYCYQTIEVKEEAARLPATYSELAGKTVGIVGAGSLGSKVAVCSPAGGGARPHSR